VRKFEAIILSGGKGSRVAKYTKKIPKSLIKINKKPFLFYQLNFLKNNNVKNVLISVGYMSNKVKAYMEKNIHFINYKIVDDGKKLLGTGGSILKFLNLLKDKFFIIYGDSYLRINLKEMENIYIKKKPKILMAVYKNNNKFDKSNININRKKELYYDKKNIKKNMKYIDYGVSIVNSSIFKQFKKKKYYNLSDIFHYFSLRNDIIGIPFKKRFFEIG